MTTPAPPTTFADPSEFTPIGAEYEAAEILAALSWATSEIIGYTDNEFSYVEDDVEVLTPGRGEAQLRHWPVVNVTLVEGLLPSGNGMAWTPLPNYHFTPTGYLYNTSGLPGTTWGTGATWPWLPGSLRVTYSHGYQTIPRRVRDVCCRLAQQYLENPELAMQSRVGDTERRFSGSAGVTISPSDRFILDRYSDVGVS